MLAFKTGSFLTILIGTPRLPLKYFCTWYNIIQDFLVKLFGMKLAPTGSVCKCLKMALYLNRFLIDVCCLKCLYYMVSKWSLVFLQIFSEQKVPCRHSDESFNNSKWCEYLHLNQLMRSWYWSHRRPAMTQMSLHIRSVSPEPSLFAQISMEVDEGSDQKSDI